MKYLLLIAIIIYFTGCGETDQEYTVQPPTWLTTVQTKDWLDADMRAEANQIAEVLGGEPCRQEFIYYKYQGDELAYLYRLTTSCLDYHIIEISTFP